MIKGIILAFQFLTRIPMPFSIEFNDKNIRSALNFFGLVGFVLGLIYYCFYSFLGGIDKLVASILVLTMMVVLTGGLHLDGLSDMFDGFLSGRDKDKILKIMKDSRIGAFGVISIVILLLFKFVFIYKLVDAISLIFITINARLCVYILILFGKSPLNNGLGLAFQKNISKKTIFISTIIYSIIIYFLNDINFYVFILTLISPLLLLNVSNKKIGGVNGDINGACVEISEVFGLILYWGFNIWKFI